MPSVVGLLEQRELGARRRVDELREEADRIQAELAVAEPAVAEREWKEWAIARSRVGEVLAPAEETGQDHAVADRTAPAATQQTGKTPQVSEAAKAKSRVPVWRQGLAWSALSVDYQRILKVLADRARLGQGSVTCQEMVAEFGMDVVPARVEALRSKAKRLVARGWLAEPAPGQFTSRRAWPGQSAGHEQGHRPVAIASALVVRRSKSRTRRRLRISHAKRRSTIHRLGSTTNPFCSSLRLTIARTTAQAARQYRLDGHRTEYTVDTRTGEIGDVLHHLDSAGLPAGHLLVRCNNRRTTRCAACAEVYRRDTFHLITSGLRGGKGVPERVAAHPRVFATFTAPGFGSVHNRPTGPAGSVRRCRCGAPHDQDDPALGTPLDPDTYDYEAAVLWNAHTGPLWRRFSIYLRREVAKRAGLTQRAFRREAGGSCV